MTKPGPLSSGSKFQGQVAIHNIHLISAILVVFLNLIGFIARLVYGRETAYAVLMGVVLPVGMLTLPVAWIYALYKTIRLEPPRSEAIVLLLFFMPGCCIPLLGPLAYLGLSLVVRLPSVVPSVNLVGGLVTVTCPRCGVTETLTTSDSYVAMSYKTFTATPRLIASGLAMTCRSCGRSFSFNPPPPQ